MYTLYHSVEFVPRNANAYNLDWYLGLYISPVRLSCAVSFTAQLCCDPAPVLSCAAELYCDLCAVTCAVCCCVGSIHSSLVCGYQTVV